MALMDAITWAARDMAISLPGNRLDPPPSLILDEIANMAAWRELPTIMSDGGGVGDLHAGHPPVAWAGSSAVGPVRDRADPGIGHGDGSAGRFQRCGGSGPVRVAGGAAEDHPDQSRTSSDSGCWWRRQSRQDDVVTVSELRRLPTGTGFMLKANVRPVVVTMSRWTQRKDADEIKAAIARFDKRLAKALTSGAETVGR